MAEHVLAVPDLSCEHCVRTINNAVKSLSGVKQVQTDIAAKKVRLRYDPDKISLAQIEVVLDRAGYSVVK